MSIDRKKYDNYLSILKEELVPSVGCTEPACLALAGAKLRTVLEAVPEKIVIKMSANLIKNTKSVVIPYSGGLKGMQAAVWLGILGGSAELGLSSLSTVTDQDIESTKKRMATDNICTVELLETPAKLHLIVEGVVGATRALVEIMHDHTNFVYIVKDGEILLDQRESALDGQALADRSWLNVQDILAFADYARLEDIEPILRPQIGCNLAISQQGLSGEYGSSVGRNLLDNFGNEVANLARACAAAASDARMSGCQMPVVINSGSGNQGITASVPVIVYAHHHKLPDEQLLRSLCVSNLVAIHQKTGVGRLSAFCGAVSAACGAGAGITYMLGGSFEQVSNTITNTLANVSGIICDGAKASCAAKIASSIDAAILALNMSFASLTFDEGDGIVKSNVEATINVIRDIASEGMRKTDLTVIKHMIQ